MFLVLTVKACDLERVRRRRSFGSEEEDDDEEEENEIGEEAREEGEE